MRLFTFGVYTIHLGRYELTRNGKALALPRVPMEILILLIEKRGNLVSRQEIAAALWPGSDPADLVQSINTAVNRIRGVLRDDPAKPTYIQTVIGKGYRFIAPVEEIVAAAAAEPAGPVVVQEAWPADQAVVPTGQAEPALSEQAVPAVAASAEGAPREERSVATPGWTMLAARRWWLVSGGMLVLAMGLLAVALRARAGSRATDLLSPERITDLASGDALTAGAISADGRRVAYADADGVTLQTLGEVAAAQMKVPPVVTIGRLAWFPDGAHLLMSADAKDTGRPQLWLLSVEGAAPRLLREDARDGVPSPDGSQVAFTADGGAAVWIAGADGEGARRLMGDGSHQTFSGLLWTTDGKQLLLSRKRSPEANPSDRSATTVTPGYHFVSADVATGRVLFETEFRFSHSCLLGDHRLLLSRAEGGEDGSSSSLWEATLDAQTGGFVSAPRMLGPRFHDQRTLALDAARETGAVVAVLRSGLPSVYVGSLAGGGSKLEAVKRLTFTMSAALPSGWTRDSQTVVFETNRNARPQMYRQRLDRHDPEAILNSRSIDQSPQVTPDGRSVLFVRKPTWDAPRVLYRVPLSGSDVAVRVEAPTPPGEFRCPRLGDACVLKESDDSAELRFVRLDPMTGAGEVMFAKPKLPGEQGDWDVSPDGLKLAMVLPEEVAPTLQIVTLGRDGSGAIVTRLPVMTGTPVRSLNWAADGRGWFLTTYNGTTGEIFYVDLTGRTTPLRQTGWFSWAIASPDGTKLAFVDEDVDSNLWQLRWNGTALGQ